MPLSAAQLAALQADAAAVAADAARLADGQLTTDSATLTADVAGLVADGGSTGSTGATGSTGSTGSTGGLPGTPTWVKLLGAFPLNDPRNGPNTGQGWWHACPLGDGTVYLSCGGVPSGPNYGSFRFDPVAGQWNLLNTDTTDFWKNLAAAENYRLCYAPDLNKVFKSAGSPNKWYNPPGNGNENTSSNNGNMSYDPTVDEWTNDYPAASVSYRPGDPASIAHWNIAGLGLGLGGFDSVYDYWQGTLYKFGGFTVGTAQNMKAQPVGAVPQPVTILEVYSSNPAKFPPWTLPSRMPYLRGGIDHRVGMAWTLADNCELYQRDLTKPANVGWIHVATTGQKPAVTAPPSYTGTDWGIVAALDETANMIVAWCAQNEQVYVPGGTAVQTTWALNLSTLVWSLLAIPAPLPPAIPNAPVGTAAGQNLIYNAQRQCCQLLTSNNRTVISTEVWELRGLL